MGSHRGLYLLTSHWKHVYAYSKNDHLPRGLYHDYAESSADLSIDFNLHFVNIYAAPHYAKPNLAQFGTFEEGKSDFIRSGKNGSKKRSYLSCMY